MSLKKSIRFFSVTALVSGTRSTNNCGADFDRNRNAMIESGRVKPGSNKILWTSAPLPNDAIVVPKGTSQAVIDQIQKIVRMM